MTLDSEQISRELHALRTAPPAPDAFEDRLFAQMGAIAPEVAPARVTPLRPRHRKLVLLAAAALLVSGVAAATGAGTKIIEWIAPPKTEKLEQSRPKPRVQEAPRSPVVKQKMLPPELVRPVPERQHNVEQVHPERSPLHLRSAPQAPLPRPTVERPAMKRPTIDRSPIKRLDADHPSNLHERVESPQRPERVRPRLTTGQERVQPRSETRRPDNRQPRPPLEHGQRPSTDHLPTDRRAVPRKGKPYLDRPERGLRPPPPPPGGEHRPPPREAPPPPPRP